MLLIGHNAMLSWIFGWRSRHFYPDPLYVEDWDNIRGNFFESDLPLPALVNDF